MRAAASSMISYRGTGTGQAKVYILDLLLNVITASLAIVIILEELSKGKTHE